MKLCIDCRYCGDKGTGFEKCNRPIGPINLVNGEKKIHCWTYCFIQRASGWFWSLNFHTCGRSGRFFEPETKS